MNDELEARQTLLARITTRRTAIGTYIHDLEPRGTYLNRVSTVCSGAASVLTAGPALGGDTFTQSTQQIFGLTNEAAVWQLLCLGAMILSLAAAVTTSLFERRNVVDQLRQAEVGQTKLEGLAVLLEFGQMPVAEAARLYYQYVNELPFVHETSSATTYRAS